MDGVGGLMELDDLERGEVVRLARGMCGECVHEAVAGGGRGNDGGGLGRHVVGVPVGAEEVVAEGRGDAEERKAWGEVLWAKVAEARLAEELLPGAGYPGALPEEMVFVSMWLMAEGAPGAIAKGEG